MSSRKDLELPTLQGRHGDRLGSSIRCINCGSYKVLATSAIQEADAGFGCGCLLLGIAAFFTAGIALLAVPFLWGGSLLERIRLRLFDADRNRTDCKCSSCGCRFWLDEHPDALTGLDSSKR